MRLFKNIRDFFTAAAVAATALTTTGCNGITNMTYDTAPHPDLATPMANLAFACRGQAPTARVYGEPIKLKAPTTGRSVLTKALIATCSARNMNGTGSSMVAVVTNKTFFCKATLEGDQTESDMTIAPSLYPGQGWQQTITVAPQRGQLHVYETFYGNQDRRIADMDFACRAMLKQINENQLPPLAMPPIHGEALYAPKYISPHPAPLIL